MFQMSSFLKVSLHFPHLLLIVAFHADVRQNFVVMAPVLCYEKGRKVVMVPLGRSPLATQQLTLTDKVLKVAEERR